MIERKTGQYLGRNKSSAYRDTVWTVATAANTELGLADQTKQTLATIQANLLELDADKSRIVSAQVYLARMSDKAEMDAIWQSWLGPEPQHWPQRVCVGVALEGNVLIEISVTAIRKEVR